MEILTKIYNGILKYSTAIIGGIIAILAAIFFSSSKRRDKLVSSAHDSKVIAAEHLELMQGDIHQAQEANQLADTIHAGVIKEVEEITQPKEPVKPGKTRKTFKIK